VNTLLKKTLIMALAAAGVPAVFGDTPKAAPAKPVPARSVFMMPANARDGRDPFFPESNRPYEDAMAAQHATVDATAIAVKGISYEHGRAMVIINNHTFALGDEGDVLTTGGRVHLRLAEIRSGSVIVEVNGSRRELSTGAK
jgi:hypothetical protein